MSGPKISVVMGVYNAEKFVRASVESVLAQTLGDFEFIIINDGSTDSSGRILSSFRDPRVKLIHQENKGLIASLNTGVKMARGEYVARQDADDLSHPERFRRQAEFLDSHRDVAIVGTASVHLTEFGDEVKVYSMPVQDDAIKKALSSGIIPICHASFMCRRGILEEVGGYREKLRLVEDYDLYFRIADRYGMANLEEPLYKVRMHPASVCAVNRHEINRLYGLVQELARERRAKGKDSLDKMTEDDIQGFVKKGARSWPLAKTRSLAANRLFLAEGLYLTRNFGSAWGSLAVSLVSWPFSLRAWGLALKMLIAWAIPRKKRDAGRS